MSSTASVNMRTCFSHWSLKTSMLSWATLLWGRAARVRAALMTCSEGGSTLINGRASGHTGKEQRVDLKASASQHATWIFQFIEFSSCTYHTKLTAPLFSTIMCLHLVMNCQGMRKVNFLLTWLSCDKGDQPFVISQRPRMASHLPYCPLVKGQF